MRILPPPSFTFDSTEGRVHMVNEEKLPEKRIFATMEIDRRTESVRMQIDTGAPCNVLPQKFVPSGTNIIQSYHTLKMYSKFTLPVLGTCRVRMRNPKNNKMCNAEFVVVKGDYTPLIGSQSRFSANESTVQQDNIQQSHHEHCKSYPGSSERGIWRPCVFKGQGCMEGKLTRQLHQ